MKISVCMISNAFDQKLIDVIHSFESVVDEICLGINGKIVDHKGQLNLLFPRLKIIEINWQGYGKTKNQVANSASNPWIFSVDADEVADESLRTFLSGLPPLDEHTAYRIRRVNYLGNRRIRYGTWGRTDRDIIRLYHRDHARWDNSNVHESLLLQDIKATKKIPGTLLHFTSEDISQVYEKHRKYAQYFSAQKRKHVLKYPFYKKYLAACIAFFKSYILKLGFMDGEIGWQLSLSIAKYSYWKYDWIDHPRAF